MKTPLQKIEHPLFDEKLLNIFVKRDDLIHPFISGNKWRKGQPVIEEMKTKQELRIIIQDYYGLKIKRYINLISYDIDSLCLKETKVIDDVIGSLSNMSASQIEEYSHGDAPWQLTGDKEVIPYSLVFERQTPYAKRKVDDLRSFKITGAKDTLNQLGHISKTEYDYYENL
jgi:uncharacterized phage-associated protein